MTTTSTVNNNTLVLCLERRRWKKRVWIGKWRSEMGRSNNWQRFT